jgi:hypothetical protein
LLIFACSKVNPHEDTPSQSKYSLIKQNAATYFGDYANAFRTTGHKYFGQAHNGIFEKTQFDKDLSTAFSEKHPVFQTPAVNKLLVKSWDAKKETLVDYMHQMGVSENVAPYVLEAQNYIVSSFDISRLESKEQDMNQVVANIVSNMDKLEAKAEQDKSLSEAEVTSLLIATTAAKNLTSAIVDVTTEFFTHLNVANGRNQASLRSFWSFVRAVVNVVTTVVVRSFTYSAITIYDTLTAIGQLIQTGNVDRFFNDLNGIVNGFGYDLTHYHCYLPDDGYQCE